MDACGAGCVGIAHHKFLEDIVLDGAVELLGFDTLLFQLPAMR